MNGFNPFSNIRTHAAGTAKNGAEVRIANPDGPLELVLVVDDDDFIVHLAEAALTDKGYRVVTARDGFQALDIFKKLQQEIHLVILDFVLPVMDGAAVLNEMRKINPHVPIVLTSGYTAQESLRELLRKGLCGFIPKPLARTKLLMCVRSTLDGSQLAGENAPVQAVS